MKQVALLLLLLGVGSVALHFLGMEFKFLSWIDSWGPTVGWAIRGAFVIVGGILFFIDMRMGKGAGDSTLTMPEPKPQFDPAPEPAPAPQPEPAAPSMGGGQPQNH